MVDYTRYQERQNGPLKKDVVEYLLKIRDENGWSYNSLGERLNISGPFTHSILNKSGNITTGPYMAKIAAGIDRLKGAPASPVTQSAIQEPVALREHSYHLRDDLRVTLRLPGDLTEREAERLAMFIRSLAQ